MDLSVGLHERGRGAPQYAATSNDQARHRRGGVGGINPRGTQGRNTARLRRRLSSGTADTLNDDMPYVVKSARDQ